MCCREDSRRGLIGGVDKLSSLDADGDVGADHAVVRQVCGFLLTFLLALNVNVNA